MGRPRKNPEDGEEMNVNRVSFDFDCHVARIGTRKYVRVPDTKQDVPFNPCENEYFKGCAKDEKTYQVFVSLENYFSALTDRYIDILEVREEILKYLNPESDTVHDRLHPWAIPFSAMAEINERIEAHFRNLQNFQNEFTAFYVKFFDIVCPADAVSPSEEMWKELAERNRYNPE